MSCTLTNDCLKHQKRIMTTRKSAKSVLNLLMNFWKEVASYPPCIGKQWLLRVLMGWASLNHAFSWMWTLHQAHDCTQASNFSPIIKWAILGLYIFSSFWPGQTFETEAVVLGPSLSLWGRSEMRPKLQNSMDRKVNQFQLLLATVQPVMMVLPTHCGAHNANSDSTTQWHCFCLFWNQCLRFNLKYPSVFKQLNITLSLSCRARHPRNRMFTIWFHSPSFVF